MEAIFPLFCVEQKLGWGKLPARFPTYLGIRDMPRRTVEFALGLDAYNIAIERSAVQVEIERIRSQWATLRAQTAKIARPASGIVNGVPAEPVVTWPPEISPQIAVSRGGTWIPLRNHVAELRERLSALEAAVVTTSGEVESTVNVERTELETQLEVRVAIFASLHSSGDPDLT